MKQKIINWEEDRDFELPEVVEQSAIDELLELPVDDQYDPLIGFVCQDPL
ncbi:MAG: hypothetical protein Q4C20_01420 [Erysipelotrichaceae bacterium]|nr:hypothetical protein [Erysipelotrichaceae bacterium]